MLTVPTVWRGSKRKSECRQQAAAYLAPGEREGRWWDQGAVAPSHYMMLKQRIGLLAQLEKANLQIARPPKPHFKLVTFLHF